MNVLTKGSLAPVLLLGYGNPSRGDDGLGPQCIELIQCGQNSLPFDTITDYQLQVEHALDLEHRQRVIFIDASVSAPAPFEFTRVLPVKDDSYTSHAMSPAAVLAVYGQVCEQALPEANLLSIRGYEFELGMAISAGAQNNLHRAISFLQQWLNTSNT